MKKIELDKGFVLEIEKEGAKLGIENIRKLLEYLFKVRSKIVKFASDGKYSFWEKLATLGLIGGLVKLIKLFPQIKAEVLDMDEGEWEEIVVSVATEFGVGPKIALGYMKDFFELLEAVGVFWGKHF